MSEAERLLRVVNDPGFVRLKRTPRGSWELWLRDGVVHVLDGDTVIDVVAQAEKLIAGRP